MARRRKKKKSIILNKDKIGISMIILWWLYIFSRYFAKGSPVFKFLTEYASIAFGQVGLTVFFILCAITWIIILSKGYLMRLIIKQFLILMIIISAILNFPIIEWISNNYELFWWYISRPLVFLLDSMFWWQVLATKAFIIILFFGFLARLLYTFNFSLPKVNIKVKHERIPKKKNKKTTIKKQESSISAKINEIKTANKEEINNNKNTETKILKDLIKKKVTEKIKAKEMEIEKPKQNIKFSADKPTFWISLMESNHWKTNTIDERFLMEKAKALQNKLMEFNVPINIEWFDIWPSIVQIKIKPNAWIRISTIEKLSNDISLSLRTKSLRVIAPIPWTSSVGIQLPNPKPSMVRLWDIISSSEFNNSMKKSSTNLALGNWIDWKIQIKELERMPHLLIAWATGSGKSVWVNDFILSLIYQNTPDELKFLMVDPKQVELELFSWLPYLLWPIVTDSDKALKLLKWTIEEMESRYTTLKEKRVKNIDEYNKKIIWQKMYRIVFVIDELADMMMSWNKKEVEHCITRIAQKARAVWIHLIVATQRPSVNVITGLIKANMPTRIAFGVVSEIDSRTILWRKWAEDLLWRWDMLYIDPTTKHPIRIQAPFVDTPEIERVIQRLKNKYMSGINEEDVYHPEVIKTLEERLEVAWSIRWWNWSDDELIEKAIQVISQTRKASATLLQRKLNVGFARAARIMDALEERWIVGPQEWAKARQIYI